MSATARDYTVADYALLCISFGDSAEEAGEKGYHYSRNTQGKFGEAVAFGAAVMAEVERRRTPITDVGLEQVCPCCGRKVYRPVTGNCRLCQHEP